MNIRQVQFERHADRAAVLPGESFSHSERPAHSSKIDIQQLRRHRESLPNLLRLVSLDVMVLGMVGFGYIGALTTGWRGKKRDG